MHPDGWQPYNLGEVAAFINGRGFKPHEWSDSGLPIIRIQNLNGSTEFNYFQGAYNPKIEVHTDDLLFAWSGSRGTSFGPHYWRGGKAVLNYHTWRVVVDDALVHKQFMFHVLEVLTTQIEGEAHGAAALVHTQKNTIERYRFWFPSLNEQKTIASVLVSWDRGIRHLSDLIAAKDRFKRGLMQQLLTGRRRFPGFSDSWRKLRVGDIANEVSERNGHGGAVPVLSCTKHDGLVDSLKYFGKQVFSDDTSNYKIVRRWDFAYATNHIEEGSIGLLSESDAGLVSPMYTVFRTNDEVLPEFLYRLFKTETYRQIFASFTSASVNRRGSLRWRQFATIPLSLPHLAEQKRIDDALATLDQEIALLRKQQDALKQQKKGLMQKLLTGQVRVPISASKGRKS